MNDIQDSNTGKLLTIAAAFLIACGSIAALGAWANASGRAVPDASVDGVIVTLPEITVRPTPEQLRELHRTDRNATASTGGGGGGMFDMPYYSFAVQPARN
ncbi:MAG: hypothetical protein JSS21_06310 [Proteobacteria bacterium]|nr:hypothetical protein [Pseudomonadota bacterium]